MPYDLRIIRSGEFLRLDAEGHFDMRASYALFCDAIWACAGNRVGRVLVDVRDATANLTAAQLIALASTCRDVSPPPEEHKIAILARPETQLDRAAMVAGLTQGAGWNIRAFSGFEEAFEWLISR